MAAAVYIIPRDSSVALLLQNVILSFVILNEVKDLPDLSDRILTVISMPKKLFVLQYMTIFISKPCLFCRLANYLFFKIS